MTGDVADTVPRVPILMYHSIGGAGRFAVGPEAFAEQLAHLAGHGYTPITFGDLIRLTTAPAGSGPDGPGGAGTARPGRAAAGGSGATEPVRLPETRRAAPGRDRTDGAGDGRTGAGRPAGPGTGAAPVARPVVLTFDDGYADFHERALPLLARYGFPATLFVTTGWLRDAGPYAAGRPLGRTLSWSELEEVAAAGVEIGGHGHSHAQLDQLGDRALRVELWQGRELLEQRLGRPVPTMAYPYGYSSARVRGAARAAGYAAACAVGNALPEAGSDVLAVPRLTVRAATSAAAFARALEGHGYRADRVLTKGYAVVRRSRYAVRRLRGAT